MANILSRSLGATRIDRLRGSLTRISSHEAQKSAVEEGQAYRGFYCVRVCFVLSQGNAALATCMEHGLSCVFFHAPSYDEEVRSVCLISSSSLYVVVFSSGRLPDPIPLST